MGAISNLESASSGKSWSSRSIKKRMMRSSDRSTKLMFTKAKPILARKLHLKRRLLEQKPGMRLKLKIRAFFSGLTSGLTKLLGNKTREQKL